MDEYNPHNNVMFDPGSMESEPSMDKMLNDEEFHRWIEAGIDSSSNELDPAIRRHLDSSVKRRIKGLTFRQRRTTVLITLAAMLAGVIIGGFSFRAIQHHEPIPSHPLIVTTGPSETAKVTLPDGTLVTINNESSLTYNYESGIRAVECDGEAFFDVAHDPDHPFIVSNGDLSVRCLGTSFDMKAYHDDPLVTVALASGRICATAGKSSVTIDPDNIVEYVRQTGKVSTRKISSSDYTEWTDGYLRFDNETLASIGRTLQRKYGVRIDIPESVASERISGNVGRCGLRDILEMLCLTSNLSYKEINDSVFKISR